MFNILLNQPQGPGFGICGTYVALTSATPTQAEETIIHLLRRPLLEESKHLTKKESKPLIGGPQGCLQRQMGGDLMKPPRTVLGTHLTDKASLPGNRAFPSRGLIRGLVGLRIWKI